MDRVNDLKVIADNIEKDIVGKGSVIELALICLLAGGHLLVEDVPGVGKTTLVSALAKSINATYKRVSCTPDVLPSDITGYSIYNRKNDEFEFREGAVMCNFLLADEINRTSPKTQSSLLEAMQEGRVSVENRVLILPQPFMVMATQNPIEHTGTYTLPEAQLDRFLMKISMGYPSGEDEERIILNKSNSIGSSKVAPVLETSDITKMQKECDSVYVDKKIASYIVRLAQATRRHASVTLGLSPRGSIGLCKAAKAHAYIHSRDYVIPDDIKAVASYVMSHRLMLTREAKANGVEAKSIIGELLNTVPING